MEFKIGDRVAIHPAFAYGFAYAKEPASGTITHITENSGFLHVNRDDGQIGYGRDGAWLVNPYITIMGKPSVTLLSTSTPSMLTSDEEKPIAGLSPEVIDQKAFDEFMRGL